MAIRVYATSRRGKSPRVGIELVRFTESLAPEAAPQLWHRWLRHYCRLRGRGVPRAVEDREKDALVQWPIVLKDVFDEVVNTFEEINGTPSTLEHFTLYRLHESHRITPRTAQQWAATFGCLAHGASKDDILAVAEHLVWLRCEKVGPTPGQGECRPAERRGKVCPQVPDRKCRPDVVNEPSISRSGNALDIEVTKRSLYSRSGT